MNNIKLRKINDKMKFKLADLPNPRISNISWSTNEKKIAFHILQIQELGLLMSLPQSDSTYRRQSQR
jgi:hypothetical protein